MNGKPSFDPCEIDRAIQRNLKGFGYLGSQGPAMGVSPKTLLYERGTLSLYHYLPLTREVYSVPLILVMATSNKACVFDLAPGQSLIEFLLKRGHAVYAMDWNPPSGEERYLKIENYVLDFIPDSIQRVQQHSGEDEVTLVGYCAGGLLSALYAALHPAGPLKNLVCFTTPVDFREVTLYRAWTGARHCDVDRLVDAVGIIQPDAVAAGFDVLRPASYAAAKVRLWENMWNNPYAEAFQQMERWAGETLPLAGEYFRQFVRKFLRGNDLYEGELTIGGKRLNLADIEVPLLHVLARHDRIVPPKSARPLIELVGSTDKEELTLPGGHVSLFAGPNAVKRMWPKLHQWIGERSA